MKRLIVLPLVLMLFYCGPKPPPEPDIQQQPAVKGLHFTELAPEEFPSFEDDGDATSLVRAIDRQLLWFQHKGQDKTWSFGDLEVPAARMIHTLRTFRQLWLEHDGNTQTLKDRIAADFRVFRIEWAGSPDILITGYHSPVLDGRLEPDDRFRFPLYRKPDDMVDIRPSQFDERMLRNGSTVRHDKIAARVENGDVVPYYTRKQIDEDGALAGRDLELVWLDDYFQTFLFHVQGGGFVRMEDGAYRKYDYAGKNSHPYTSIGRFLVEEGKIPENEISIQAIQRYFAANPGEIKRVCYANASYVFYTTDGRSHPELHPDMYPVGIMGFPVTPQRSIATDKKYFPGGALAFVSGVQRQSPEDSGLPFSRFALDQDTGGAIKHAHIDFYQGAGEEAEHKAGLLKDEGGRLYLLLAREDNAL